MEALDLNENPNLEPFTAVTWVAKSNPHLKSLSLSLNKEEQVDFIIRNLKELKVLNGLEVDREELEAEELESREQSKLESSSTQ